MAVNISQAASSHENSGPLPRRGQHPSGTGGSNGGTGGHAGGGSAAARPRFDAPVAQNGYRWWYIDATSDDGKYGLTIIGFVGSVFSPYYARARKKGLGTPENHCAINVALYGSPKRWAMTERGASHIKRSSDQFTVGPSSMAWKDNRLNINISERCVPLPFALKGQVSVQPDVIYNAPVQLDAAGKHFWQAVAPHSRITVSFENPKLTWSGKAYHDMNWGDEPLEQGFRNWTWLRANTPKGTEVLYDLERRDGTLLSFGRTFQAGAIHKRNVPELISMKRGLWGMTRNANSEETPELLAKLEDAPFYTRNHISMVLDGTVYEAYHETLSLDRFSNPIVQLMLPFRMPRRS